MFSVLVVLLRCLRRWMSRGVYTGLILLWNVSEADTVRALLTNKQPLTHDWLKGAVMWRQQFGPGGANEHSWGKTRGSRKVGSCFLVSLSKNIFGSCFVFLGIILNFVLRPVFFFFFKVLFPLVADREEEDMQWAGQSWESNREKLLCHLVMWRPHQATLQHLSILISIKHFSQPFQQKHHKVRHAEELKTWELQLDYRPESQPTWTVLESRGQ